ncbi:DUF896 domain-containing protein [Clostridium sp. JN-1]|uniref:DUF896 domain-containing protein n=1 Tax=Clostridium sp. JN-1 TaxID=2483110 RepID=UPI000F0B2833|nr:DUF896 domain-containing protein [Clostridium sp. JN-1]
MNIDKLIQRINFLYKKSKETGLSNDEIHEQKKLRDEYINLIKGNLKSQLKTIKKSSN